MVITPQRLEFLPLSCIVETKITDEQERVRTEESERRTTVTGEGRNWFLSSSAPTSSLQRFFYLFLFFFGSWVSSL